MKDNLGNDNAVTSGPPATPDPEEAVDSVASFQGHEVLNTVNVPPGITPGPMGPVPNKLPFD